MFVRRMRQHEIVPVNAGNAFVPGTLVRESREQFTNTNVITGVIVAVEDNIITVCWSERVWMWTDDVAEQIMQEEDAYILRLLATQANVKP